MATKNLPKQHTPLFEPIRNLIFQLPIQERLELVEEVQKQDWKQDFRKLCKDIGQELKASGITQKNIPDLIKKARAQH